VVAGDRAAGLKTVAPAVHKGRGGGAMTDLATALALLLVLEGLLWAVSPNGMKRAAAMALSLPNEQLRIGGLIGVAIGVLLVWLLRG
jgi:uncharacterized protein